ncbi:hypothetical protein [Paucibacter soli]|uniref:hypothetical protein n=1 Tax=Paucibacter soli TaxID=3133433 RepID=UPI003098964E
MNTSTNDNIPLFQPRLEAEPGMGLYYRDGRVEGAVDVNDQAGVRSLCISEWSSLFTGRGFTKEALTWLREQGFSTITANGVGLIEEFDGLWAGDIATCYWARMREHGLVDVLIDDNGRELTAGQIESIGQPATQAPRMATE